jgi:cytoskeletal protein CcmA (bactofilin family)
MGATYTRQSSYSDGDVITAAHTNDEFNQLLAAFAASSGHTHDGTTAEGGPITKLLGTSLTFGDGTAGTDITVTFDGETNDGVLKWMEDEDYFEFSDDILVASTEKLQFRDTAIYINSSTDGQLDLVADTEIQIAATTVDLNGNLDVSGSITLGGTAITSTATELNVMDGGTSATSTTLADADRVVVNDAGTMKQVALTDFETYFESALDTLSNVTTVGALNSGSITSGFGTIDTGASTITTTGLITGGSLDIDDVLINGSNIGHTDDTDLITVANGLVTVAGEISVTTLDIGGTNVAATATELNIMDGDTSATSTTLADADRVVVNDAGTMKQVALTDFETYFESALDTLSNVTTVGALNSGSITSGFGAIDNGSSAITTTGTITYGSLSDGSITITAFVDEDNMASNSATLVPTQQSVKAYVDTQLTAEDLDITTDSGTIDIDLDSETLTIAGGTGLSSSASSSTVTMAIDAAQTGITSVVNSSLELGRDADNRIKFGTDNQIIFEVDGGDNVIFKASGEIEATSLDISGDADIDGTLEADAITVNGTALNTVIAGVTVANATTAAVATTVTISDNESTNEDNAIIFTSGGDVDGGNIGLESDGDLTYNPSTGRLTATQLSGTLQTAAQGNVTSLGTLTTLTVDNVIINGSTIGHTGDTDLMTVASGVLTVAGEVDATSLDISGDADIDGTLEADAITVNGTALNTVIANEATALAIALG